MTGSLGGVDIDWKQAAKASSLGFVAFCLVGAGLFAASLGSLRQISYLFQPWVLNLTVPSALDIVAMVVFMVLWGFSICFGFVFFHEAIPGGRLTKGMLYGLGIWTLGVLPYELIDIQTTRIPTSVWLVNFLVISLVWLLVTGAAMSMLYPWRFRRGESLWRGAGRKRAPVRFAPAAASAAINLLVMWVLGFVFFIFFDPFKTASVLFRANLAAGQEMQQAFVGMGGAGIVLVVLFSVGYGLVREGAPWKGAKGGLFFGFWLWFMLPFPLSILFLPIGTLPTSFVVYFLTLFSLLLSLAMGAVAGGVFSDADSQVAQARQAGAA
ncbi:MAG: hypothetical protein ACYC99_06020 [Candidatus Geothermincolia bacterium]